MVVVLGGLRLAGVISDSKNAKLDGSGSNSTHGSGWRRGNKREAGGRYR